MKNTVKNFLTEPLFHFLILATLVFGLYGFLNTENESDNSIVISANQLDKISNRFRLQWNRVPTNQELENLVELHVKEEILYQEALKLGLDENDQIVRRRMAQKIQFIEEDVSKIPVPEEEMLRTWFNENTHLFSTPKRVSFKHLYFSPDKNGGMQKSFELASATFEDVKEANFETKLPADISDQFMGQDHFSNVSVSYIQKQFGSEFAAGVAQATDKAWTKPIRSGFGWHLVYIDDIEDESLPEYSAIKDTVKGAWLEVSKRTVWEDYYNGLLEKYTVSIEYDENGV